MDYRYETKDEARDFHRRRKAFIILDGELEFIPEGSPMSHFEFCQTKGLDKEVFNQITRGYYLDGNVVIYKDNFIYDDNVISEALNYLDDIAKKILVDKFNIYFGLIIERDFAFNYHYGKYTKGLVVTLVND